MLDACFLTNTNNTSRDGLDEKLEGGLEGCPTTGPYVRVLGRRREREGEARRQKDLVRAPRDTSDDTIHDISLVDSVGTQ